MKASSLIHKEFVFLDLNATSKKDAIDQIIQKAKDHPDLGDFHTFYRAVFEREAGGSTSIGYGIAVPHARTDQVKKILLVVGRLVRGVSFEPSDERPVQLIFLMGTPKKMVTEYLQLIGSLAHHLKKESIRKKLLEAKDVETFIQSFIESEHHVRPSS